ARRRRLDHADHHVGQHQRAHHHDRREGGRHDPRGRLRRSIAAMTQEAAIDYEAEYNNRRRVPEYPEIAERWALLANAYRLAGDAELDQAYGTRERQRYDLFHAADKDAAPLVVYIHGGYWQRGDRKDYSFVARELNANGITVAIPSYTLSPAVSVMEI